MRYTTGQNDMGELENLRPEVCEAVRALVLTAATSRADLKSSVGEVRAELLRLTDENAQLRDVLADRDMDREMAAHANKTLADARETIKRLNRRVQVAEAAVAEKIKASAPGSLGRALANAAALKADAELAAIKARIAEAPSGTYARGIADHGVVNTHQWIPARLVGKRVRLLVDEPEDRAHE